jgi:thioesterase domain-containing protein
VAAALEAAGEEVALLGLLDALTVAEGGPDIRTANPLRVMAEEFGVYDARLKQELASTDRAGQWELVAARARAIGALAPHFDGAQLARVYHVLGEVLVPQVQRWTFPTVRARALLITSAESRERMGETLGWERYMRREQLDVVPVEGSHIGTLHAPRVEAVAQRLRGLLGLTGGAD